MESKSIIALVLGATGEVGTELVKQLVTHPAFTQVITVGRRPLEDIPSDKLTFRKVDFDNLEQDPEVFHSAQVAYCCLGTTRANAGKEGFIKVDRDYVVGSATLLKNAGCQHFHLVTSHGSNKSSMMLYQKTKGEVEEMVAQLNFPRLSVYRPGLLLCDRKETRLVESFLQTLAKGFDWRNRMSVHTETVAKAMITNTLCPPSTPDDTAPDAGSVQQPLVEIIAHSDILRLGTD